MNRLDNKVCIVTGGAKGIGASIVRKFAAEGAKVYIFDFDVASIETWINEIPESQKKLIIGRSVDICEFKAVTNEIMQIKKAEGHIDVLANNAGIVSYEMMSMIDYNKLRKMFDVNVIALINITQTVARVMARQKSGSIINMASIVGLQGAKGQLSYSATKSAAKELCESGIRVNAIAPGMISSERFQNVMQEKFSNRIETVGFGRLGTPDEVADAFLFFASDESSYITGQVLAVDGCINL
jgi:3-oxoacyl-[acyl-carrier protein] reductase